MPAIRALLLGLLLVARISSHVIPVPVAGEHDEETLSDVEAFQKLLEEVEASDLHRALHAYTPRKLQHVLLQDVLPAENIAGEDTGDAGEGAGEVAGKDPPARITRRQNIGNSSIDIVIVTVSHSTEIIQTLGPNGPTSEAVVINIPITITKPGTPSPPLSTAAGSVSVDSTPLGSGPAGSSNLPNLPTQPTSVVDSLGPTAAVTGDTTAGESGSAQASSGSAQTSAPGETIPSSSGQSYSEYKFTSLVVYTTTLSNGAVDIVTAYSVINAPTAASGEGASGTSETPGLQTPNSSTRTSLPVWRIVGAIVGAVGFATII